ncbi:MAG: alkyl hydroperoxide reductase [Planctomycetota bacterium]
MTWCLGLAAAYNLAWGAWVVLLPNSFFQLAGMEPPLYLSIWQCVGMIVGVYGIGYAAAALDPARHWPIVLVGLLGKIAGPVGYVDAAWVRGTLDPAFGYTIPTNDLIWWLPFTLILVHAWRVHRANATPATTSPETRADASPISPNTAPHPATPEPATP